MSQKGYTLIELLLYVAVTGSLLISVSYFFGTAAEARIKNQSVSEVNIHGELAMEYLTQTIRNASSISAPLAGASSASLTLVVPTGGLSPTTFDLTSTTLQVKEGAAAYVALTSDKVQITNLFFKNLSRPATPGLVQVSFDVSRTNLSGRNAYDYQKTFISSASLRHP